MIHVWCDWLLWISFDRPEALVSALGVIGAIVFLFFLFEHFRRPVAMGLISLPVNHAQKDDTFPPAEGACDDLVEAKKRRILLIGHDVTLAHFARPLQLAIYLHEAGHDVILAASERSFIYAGGYEGKRHFLEPTDSVSFLCNLRRGQAHFDANMLRQFAEEDEVLLTRYKPDIVIGDFRISLSVSARRHRIPFAAISNAYWNPASEPFFIVPDLPMVRYLGIPISQFLFDLVRPLAFTLFCRPINALRRIYGLSSLGSDIRAMYCESDLLLFSDVPDLYPPVPPAVPTTERESPSSAWLPWRFTTSHTRTTPKTLFLGPILWSPHAPLPTWWAHLLPQVPTIYVTLGSSGDPQLLSKILLILKKNFPHVQILASTLGATDITPDAHLFCAEFLPATQCCAIAQLVICNGGSPTSSVALAHGVPVLAFPSNLDQLLNMHFIDRQGASLTLRNFQLSEENITDRVKLLLTNPSFTTAAKRISHLYAQYKTQELICNDAINILSATYQKPQQ